MIPSSVTFNIPQLFEDVFSIYTRFPVYFLGDKKPGSPPAPVPVEEWNLTGYEPATTDQLGRAPHLVSPYGVPLWDRFGFKDVFPLTLRRDDNIFYLPIATIAEVNMAKNIVTTPLIGRNGSVKELMSDGDHVITFRGFVINFDNPKEYPSEEVERLNTLIGIKSSLPVVSKLLNNAHQIHDIVFTNKTWLPIEGYANVQPFEFTALSDTNIVLELSS